MAKDAGQSIQDYWSLHFTAFALRYVEKYNSMEEFQQPSNKSIFFSLWVFFAVFIVYGTLIPFSWVSSWEAISTNISRIAWIPFVDPDGSRASIPDIVQNVLLFLPFGFFGFIVLQPKIPDQICSIIPRILLVGILGLFLSLAVENCQLLVTDRVTSVTDLITNSFGAICGAIVSFFYFETLQKLLISPLIRKASDCQTFYPFLISLIIVTIGALQPFDFSIDVGRIGSRVLGLLRNPLNFSLTIRDEPFLFFRYLIFGYICTLWIEESGQRNASLKAAFLSSITAIFLEASQIFTNSHIPGLQDTLIMVFGSICGALFLQNIVNYRSSTLVCSAVIIATIITSGIQVLSPFQIKSEYLGMNFIPFLPYYERNFITALGLFVESILIYFPLGFILRLLLPKTKKYYGVICFASLGPAATFEFTQGWIVDRYPDITDILGAISGSFIGSWCGYSGWNGFDRLLERERLDTKK